MSPAIIQSGQPENILLLPEDSHTGCKTDPKPDVATCSFSLRNAVPGVIAVTGLFRNLEVYTWAYVKCGFVRDILTEKIFVAKNSIGRIIPATIKYALNGKIMG